MTKFMMTILSLGCTVVLSTATASADQVVLNNGDRLTGRVTSRSATELTIDTELAGRVTVKMSAVSLVTPAPTDATPDAPRWHGTVNAGVDVGRGNTETSAISTNGAVTRLGPRDRFGVFGSHLSSVVGSGADSVTTARATRGGFRYDHDLKGQLYGFGFFDAENDALQLLDLRTVTGGGAGAHLVKTPTTQLNLFAGVSYARDSYTAVATTANSSAATTSTTKTTGSPATTPGQGGTPPGQGGTPPGQTRIHPTRGGTPPSIVRTSLARNVGEVLLGQDVSHQLSDSMGLTEALTVFPAISEFSDYRVSFDVSLWAQLNGWLQWHATVSDRYLHIPPGGGAVQNDTFVSTGLGITFGNGGSGAYTGADGRRPRR